MNSLHIFSMTRHLMFYLKKTNYIYKIVYSIKKILGNINTVQILLILVIFIKNTSTYYEKYGELDEYSNFIRDELENLIKNPSEYKTNILEEVQKKLEDK